jgi:hypothetical protein
MHSASSITSTYIFFESGHALNVYKTIEASSYFVRFVLGWANERSTDFIGGGD